MISADKGGVLPTSAPAVGSGVSALAGQFVLHRWTGLTADLQPLSRGRPQTGGHTAVVAAETEARTVHVRLALTPAGGRLVEAHLTGLGWNLRALGEAEAEGVARHLLLLPGLPLLPGIIGENKAHSTVGQLVGATIIRLHLDKNSPLGLLYVTRPHHDKAGAGPPRLRLVIEEDIVVDLVLCLAPPTNHLVDS